MALEKMEPENRLEWFIYHAGQGEKESSGDSFYTVNIKVESSFFGNNIVEEVQFIGLYDGQLSPFTLYEGSEDFFQLAVLKGSNQPITLQITTSAEFPQYYTYAIASSDGRQCMLNEELTRTDLPGKNGVYIVYAMGTEGLYDFDGEDLLQPDADVYYTFSSFA